MISCLRRWIAAFRKDCSERGLQKMDSDLRNLVTVEDMKKFETSAVARQAINCSQPQAQEHTQYP